jgi:hypothetical protein
MIKVAYIFTIFAVSSLTNAWNQWKYNTTWSSNANDVNSKKLQWFAIWPSETYNGIPEPPRPRRGHSLHLIETDPLSVYGGATYLVLFGGRDNNQNSLHVPRTYNVKTVCDFF